MQPSNWAINLTVLLVAGLAGVLVARGLTGFGLVVVLCVGGLAGGALLRAVLEQPDPLVGQRAQRNTISSTKQRPDPAQVSAELIELVPVALILLDGLGVVKQANRKALDLMPRLSEGGHFTSQLRGPGLVEAFDACVATDTAQSADVVLHGARDLVLTAHLSPFPEELRSPSGELILMIEDRTALRQLDRARSDFVANASHEMRTPLASIMGYIETLKGVADDDPVARTRFLDIMGAQAQRLERLTRNLTSLTRIELDERVPIGSMCDPYLAASEAVAALKPMADRSDARISVDLPSAQDIPGDRDQIVQVFVNLIENALKYGGPKVEIDVSVATTPPPAPGFMGVTISDNGPGVRRDEIPRLTERFYRSPSLRSAEKGGSGLGLAIVKHILNRHGGSLQIESAPRAGYRVTVWLPKALESS